MADIEELRKHEFVIGTDIANSVIIIKIGEYIQQFDQEAAFWLLGRFNAILAMGEDGYAIHAIEDDGTLSSEPVVRLSRSRIARLLPAFEHLVNTGRVERDLL